MNIYKIVCRTTGKIYVGSTKLTIEERLKMHESNKRCWERGTYHYVTSFKVLESNDYDIELIEVCDEEERNVREGFYIQTLNTVNRFIAGRNKKEYIEEHRDEINAKQKEYNKDHKDELKKYFKEYREDHKDELKAKKGEKITCECGSVSSNCHIGRHHRTKKHLDYINVS